MSGMAQTPASGILFALSAGILWGFVPVYINFFGNVDPQPQIRFGETGLCPMNLIMGFPDAGDLRSKCLFVHARGFQQQLNSTLFGDDSFLNPADLVQRTPCPQRNPLLHQMVGLQFLIVPEWPFVLPSIPFGSSLFF